MPSDIISIVRAVERARPGNKGFSVKANRTLTIGLFQIDILKVQEGNAMAPRFYWCIRRSASPDIVNWGQEPSAEKAEEQARLQLRNIEGDESSRA